jgi:hypothetical protein
VHNEILARLDSNDIRMQQVDYANGKLWDAFDTAVTLQGVNRGAFWGSSSTRAPPRWSGKTTSRWPTTT